MKTTAIVTIKVEVVLSQPWSQDAALESVWREAKREAIEKLTCAIQKHHEIRLAGDPKVQAVLTEQP